MGSFAPSMDSVLDYLFLRWMRSGDPHATAWPGRWILAGADTYLSPRRTPPLAWEMLAGTPKRSVFRLDWSNNHFW